MIRHHRIEPRFVTEVPRDLESGVLYISTEYGTAVHSCCCGCGQEVVTPLTPTDWKLSMHGNTVSLWPSVGNWNLPCKSHYVIRGNLVIEAAPWTPKKIESEIRRDKAAKASYYSHQAKGDSSADAKRDSNDRPQVPARAEGWLARLLRWIFG
ncbi:DUF6527 family protein [Paraburkholderia tagetis]|uniref:Uncharacterized protein n=1 Tax=Paraburkholderia tagetis TaxID=2913261 RepID=A0A9X2A066_9BURK|nr:DUF6527 family protein [Paraburkholderia tagetis]MCG5078259.1 hypothetical protein [Paraburkholderia tagetis]